MMNHLYNYGEGIGSGIIGFVSIEFITSIEAAIVSKIFFQAIITAATVYNIYKQGKKRRQ